MAHLQFIIQADEPAQELLIAQLEELGATGFEQRTGELLAYFESGSDCTAVATLLNGYSWKQEELEERNWNAVWESAFEPVAVGRFCGIRAHFHELMKGFQHELLITPKMSFGTGHHATTFLMVEAMEHHPMHGKLVFDFGTGTGVLAILAEKLGAASILAIDVDDWSIENAIENAALNHCRKIEVRLASAPPAGQKFDLILANINRHVLLKYMPSIRAAMTEEGTLLLSGILEADEGDIVECCQQNGIRKINSQVRNGWMMIHCRAN